MSDRFRVAVFIVALAGGALSGQRVTSPAPQTPTFKVSVEYVEVDAVVTDRNGNFVRDLKQEDFQLFEDGKPQTVSTFSLVDIPIERAQRPVSASQPIEPDVRSNERPFDGRIYVMVVDDLHTNFGRTGRVRAAARRFIDQHLGANDLMAIVHTAGPTDASQDFTSSKRLLLAAIDRTGGRKLDSATLTRTESFFDSRRQSSGDPVTDAAEAERAFNARRSLDTLRNVAQWFASVRGRRKAILFVSEGIDYDITNWADNPNASLIIASTRDAIAAAARGNVSIYGIDPRGLTSLAEETIQVGSLPDDARLGIGVESLRQETLLSQSSLRELSGQSGGFAAVNANEFSSAFDRIVRDNSSYYVLAYYPPMGKAGTFHRIEVRVGRPGLTVRARQGYLTLKPAPPASTGTSAKNAENDPRKIMPLMTPAIRDALDSPLPLGGLVMNVFASPFKGMAPNASVLVGVEVRGHDLRLDPSDKLTVTYAAVDAEGKIRGGNTDAVLLNLKPDTKDRVAQTSLRLLGRVDLPPGRYQLHVAAEDAGSGKVGSVLYDLDVPDFTKAPLSMSGLVLTSAAASAEPTVRPDEQLKQLLPSSPVATRTFPQNDQIALFVEVYDNHASTPHKIDITMTVTTDDGRVMLKADEVRNSSEIQGRRGGYGYAARIPMKDLAPGPYVLTVQARSRLDEAPAVERQVQFTVAPSQVSK